MEFFAILTLARSGGETVTATQVVTVDSYGTRREVYQYMKDQLAIQLGPRFAHANTIFFSAEPNSIGH